MLKKFCASLLALLILASFSVSVYAGQTDSGININTTQPVGSGLPLIGPATSPFKGITPSNSAILNEPANTTMGSVTVSAVTTGSAVTTTSAVTGKDVKKPVFEEVFPGILKDGMAINDPYFVMTITNPQMDKESTTYKSYILSGNSKYDDVIVSIAKYNENKGEYEPMTNTDGESSWKLGPFGECYLFSKEIILTDGPNKIKMIAYRTSQKEEAVKDNIQVNCFTISLLKPSLFTKTKNTFIQAAEAMGLDIGKTKK